LLLLAAAVLRVTKTEAALVAQAGTVQTLV
jgi:hypothetical protein